MKKFATDAQEDFLDEYYANGGHIAVAARTVGFYHSTIDHHRRHNAKFARGMKEVEEELGLERAEAAETALDNYKNSKQRRGATQHRNWRPAFLKCLAINGCVRHAAHAAGIDPRTAYNARQKDEEFALQWADAVEHSTDSLEAEGIRRALNISDLLLMFFLKARRPHLYRENAQIWKEQLDEQHMATIVDAVKTAAFRANLPQEELQSFTEELANELSKFEKAGA